MWILYILYIIGGCDCDIILFAISFSQLFFSVEGGVFILFTKVLMLLFCISLNIGYVFDLVEFFITLEYIICFVYFSITWFTHGWMFFWVWVQRRHPNINSGWYYNNSITCILIIVVKYIMWIFRRKWYQFIVIGYEIIWNEYLLNNYCRNTKVWGI